MVTCCGYEPTQNVTINCKQILELSRTKFIYNLQGDTVRNCNPRNEMQFSMYNSESMFTTAFIKIITKC